MDQSRRNLDSLFLLDANLSFILGSLALLSPHAAVEVFSEYGYNHGAHEALRLYGCLKIAVGWMLFRIRNLDDGHFRKSICEALGFCYALQALAVCRAQFTDRHSMINWVLLVGLSILCGLYLNFRFGRGGHLIKVYELPFSSRSIV